MLDLVKDRGAWSHQMMPTLTITEQIATIISAKTPWKVIGTKPNLNHHITILENTTTLILGTLESISFTRKNKSEMPQTRLAGSSKNRVTV